MADERPIGFLDSGIGGITVLREAVRLLPEENYFFFSDSANNPYGSKSDGFIISRCGEIADFLINEKNCKAIVIACNTASAKASRQLRAQFADIPIIAIEPACKMVYDSNPEGRTLIMATRGTIRSEKFRRLYYSYYNHRTVLLPCAGLADLIEQGESDGIMNYLEAHLGRYRGSIRNVVLGCTHYPLIKKEISEVLGSVRFFDGAEGVSRRLKYLLEENGISGSAEKRGTVEFFDSSPDESIKKERFYNLLGEI